MKKFMAKVALYNGLSLGLLRILVGVILVYHGFGKIQGDFAHALFKKLGYPVPEFFGYFISFVEFFGGILLVAGLFTRYLGVVFTILFLVTVYTQWIVFRGGYGKSEFELLLTLASAVLATSGSGSMALDKTNFGRRFQ